MSIRIGNVGIDTTDLAGASAFWQAVTHYEISSSGDDHTYLVDPAKEGPGLFVQLVPSPASARTGSTSTSSPTISTAKWPASRAWGPAR